VGQRPTLDGVAELGDAEFAQGAKQRGLDDERHGMKVYPPAANTRSWREQRD
jgi:hypothetical protein